MKTQTRYFTVRIRADQAHLPGFLDMLRYEGATVRDWFPTIDQGGFKVTLSGPRFTPDRWASFGILANETI